MSIKQAAGAKKKTVPKKAKAHTGPPIKRMKPAKRNGKGVPVVHDALWIGPGQDHLPDEKPMQEVGPQEEVIDIDPLLTVQVRIPRETYVALGKLTKLLKKDDSPEEVGRIIVEAVEDKVIVLLGRVNAINKGVDIDTVYSKHLRT